MFSQDFRLMHLLLASTLVLATPVSSVNINRCFNREVNYGIDSNFSRGVSKFGLNFFRTVVAAQEVGENLVVSPYSVWNALCLTFFGSQGVTRSELTKVLRLPSKTTTYTNWRHLQSRLTAPAGSSSTFLSTSRAYFSSQLTLNGCLASTLPEMEGLDFRHPVKAARVINAYVSAATRGEIDGVVDETGLRNVEFVVLNAVFFKGRWKTLFPANRTQMRDFQTESSQNVTVPMMTTSGRFNYTQKTDLGASMVSLPYEDGFSLLVLLPFTKTRAESVVARLTWKRLEGARHLLRENDVLVAIPKFSITSKLSDVLKQTLRELGLVDLFSSSINLNSFTKGNFLLSSVIHQATVRVDEEGTVAAAVTAALGTRVGPTKFTCNRPFVFVLVDDAMGLPILTGVYNGPQNP